MIELSELQQTVKNRALDSGTGPRLPPHIGHFADALHIRPPTRTMSAFVLPYSSNRKDPDWAKIIAFGSYRLPFSVIEELARTLAVQAVETGIIPIIRPIHLRSLESMTWATPLIRAISMKGVSLYYRGNQHDA